MAGLIQCMAINQPFTELAISIWTVVHHRKDINGFHVYIKTYEMINNVRIGLQRYGVTHN